MGLGDWLGGKKMPKPPPEFYAAARAAFGVANDAKERLPMARTASDAYLKELPGYVSRETDFYGDAAAAAADRGGDYASLWDGAAAPILQQTGQEVLDAGSMMRQREEAERVAEMFNVSHADSNAAQMDALARSGRFGAGAFSSVDSAVAAAARAGLENKAMLDERNRGEAVRRAFVPHGHAMGRGKLSDARDGGGDDRPADSFAN